MGIVLAAKISKIFLIFDLPNKTTGFGMFGLVSISGPAGEIFTLQAAKDQVDTALAAASVEDEARIDESIVNWDKARGREQKVFQDGTSQGILLDNEAKRQLARDEIGTVLGVWVPRGGFIGAFRNAAGASGGRVIR